MKGVVFKEFLKLVDKEFGETTTESVIVDSKIESQGAYTSVGKYDHNEIIKLVKTLSEKTNHPIGSLMKVFGQHLFKFFVFNFPDFFQDKDLFEFIQSVDSIIHVEVLKLYPDAELPKFDSVLYDQKTLVFTYKSKRPFADLAEGLILAAINHFNEKVSLEITNKDSQFEREFILKKE